MMNQLQPSVDEKKMEKVYIEPTNMPHADYSATTPNFIPLKYIGTFQYQCSPWVLKIN